MPVYGINGGRKLRHFAHFDVFNNICTTVLDYIMRDHMMSGLPAAQHLYHHCRQGEKVNKNY